MWHSKALLAFSSSQISSCSHSDRMFGNESIVVFESLVEIDEVLDVGIAGSIGLTLLLGSITATGLFIKGIFIYYIKYAAPKERPINNMIFYDQVSYIVYMISFKGSVSNKSPFFVVSSICSPIAHCYHDDFANCHSSPNERNLQ